MTRRLKAYRVESGDDDGHAVIVFHTNNASARHAGAAQLDSTFEDVEYCRRAPQFDHYAPGPVPPTALIADGWWQECLHCGVRVTSEGEAYSSDIDDYVDLNPVDHGDQVFCCPACQAKYFAEQRANAAARVALQELVETKWPAASVTDVHVYGQKLESSDRRGGIKCVAHFRLPGLQYPAAYHFGDESHLHVCQGDVEVFNERYGARA